MTLKKINKSKLRQERAIIYVVNQEFRRQGSESLVCQLICLDANMSNSRDNMTLSVVCLNKSNVSNEEASIYVAIAERLFQSKIRWSKSFKKIKFRTFPKFYFKYDDIGINS